ncbi:ParA family protein [Chamaesiphon sp.]|uniref:ParA family protein n=1 Tax=Chamaesiphon sp. TaxID=2814140 RepID=UPI003592EBE2
MPEGKNKGGRKNTHIGLIQRRLDIWLTPLESAIFDTIKNRGEYFADGVRQGINYQQTVKQTISEGKMVQVTSPVKSQNSSTHSRGMVTIVVSSLAGGQGKTTVSMLLGLLLARAGHPTLLVDADPQHSLTDWIAGAPAHDAPTLLECLTNKVPVQDCIYPLDIDPNLFLIPSDDQLDNVQDYLASSGMGAMLLKKRLEPMATAFEYCIIDAPPQRSQISLTVIGAGDLIVVPVEASVKGYGSLIRTIDLIKNLQINGATTAQIVGVIPFRDRFVGNNQTTSSKESIDAMRDEVGSALVLSSIVESERYKQAINQRKTLTEIGYPDLEHPLKDLASKINLAVGN